MPTHPTTGRGDSRTAGSHSATASSVFIPRLFSGRRRRVVLAAVLVLTALLGPLLLVSTAAAASPLYASASSSVSTHRPAISSVQLAAAPDITQAPPADRQTARQGPRGPQGPKDAAGANADRRGGDTVIDLGSFGKKPSSSLTVILLMTLLSLLPALVLSCTSFTKILIVLGLTRNALGLQQTPNNQVLAGLALFLSLFIMSPTLAQINEVALGPYLDGNLTATQAYDRGIDPLRTFMLTNTDDAELQLLNDVAQRPRPSTPDDISTATLVPAFILSEIKQAFTIGFIIFVPFLVIDLLVAGTLMSLGMMMMPPSVVSLPFKLLLFVMVDGWGLVVTSLVASYGASP